jgi:hypothetical protein
MIMFKRYFDLSSNQWEEADLGAYLKHDALRDHSYFDWVVSEK